MSFDINMNMAGLLPSQGGGGQFPANTDETPFHRCAIKSGERKMNSKNTGETVQLILEGKSKEVAGMTHKVTINIAHSDPEVAKRGAQDMLAYVYAALGVTQIGNASALFGREIGVVVKPDPSNKEGENYTRVDHVTFADGRPLVVNGQLQPFQAAPGGAQGFQQQGGGFQPQQQPQQQQQPQGGAAGGFQSGAQVQQTGQFQPQGGGFQTGTMPNPNGAQPQQQQQQQPQPQQGYQSPGQFQQQPQGGAPAGGPSWANG